ncbi:LysR substrate-binding domain-containing protein [Herbaspirillum robiniae]|uniref:LysR family transcriptional regulator n=1 Tax=Herbaspirillum robiniae TaxID=2014887 RepID=A0A246WKV7_9BURK|nr:LysR substrate-binding domain-containing protein [Herbaspirillum robiniae]NUU04175.1 LysR family transcriptional regulator [Herbaspirillum robiniae]OWY26957.1 LysR family transcriptional regulator [Herbaspirillum robiniae]
MLNNLARKLDLTTLRLFAAVQEEGTLTRAAAREAIAVSAASKRLVELEEAIGMPLFVRHARGMELTAAGETLFSHARRVLLSVDAIGHELAEHAQGVRGYVRMVANLSAIVEFLPEDLMLFSRLHEQVKLDLEERPSGSVVKGVADGWADLGICSGEADTGDLQTELYRRDHVVLVMGASHPLARRKHVSFEESLDYDHVGLHADSSINQRTHLAARSSGKPLKMRIHVPGFDAVCRMAQAGMGLGVIPAGVFEAIGRPLGLAAVAIDEPWAHRELRIVVRHADALSPVSRALFDFLRGAEERATPAPSARKPRARK